MDAFFGYCGQPIKANGSCHAQFKEVRVRYAGFGKEEDEWVNVKEGVRERSIPLEASECHKVKDGDVVLCFLVRDPIPALLLCLQNVCPVAT